MQVRIKNLIQEMKKRITSANWLANLRKEAREKLTKVTYNLANKKGRGMSFFYDKLLGKLLSNEVFDPIIFWKNNYPSNSE